MQPSINVAQALTATVRRPALCRRALAASLLLASLSIGACNDSTEPQTATCSAFLPISLGSTEIGTLSSSDCRLASDNSFYDHWRLVLAQEATVQFDMMSEDFDTFLILNNDQGIQVAFVDDGGEGSNSRLTITLNAGTYQIFANSLEAGDTGAYSLTVTIPLE